jgi:hypothetical protein
VVRVGQNRDLPPFPAREARFGLFSVGQDEMKGDVNALLLQRLDLGIWTLSVREAHVERLIVPLVGLSEEWG